MTFEPPKKNCTNGETESVCPLFFENHIGDRRCYWIESPDLRAQILRPNYCPLRNDDAWIKKGRERP